MESFQGKKIIVTGGAGFIGSHLAAELVRLGAKVLVIDNEFTGKESNLEEARSEVISNPPSSLVYIKEDICNYPAIEKIFKDFSEEEPKDEQISVVFHEAAVASVPRSIADPKLSFQNNVIGTLNILLASKECKVKRVLFASSSSVYGDNPTTPKKEEDTGKTLSPYALTKHVGEEMLRQFYELYGLETVALRYFNVFGPRQDPNGPYAAVIPLFIKKMLNKENPVIFGDGLQSRDFTPVKNVVQGNLLFALASAEKVAGKVFNLAGGNSISLIELVNHLNTILNTSLLPVFQAERKGDIKNSSADISKAQFLGFTPQVTFLEGLQATVESHKNKNKNNQDRFLPGF